MSTHFINMHATNLSVIWIHNLDKLMCHQDLQIIKTLTIIMYCCLILSVLWLHCVNALAFFRYRDENDIA
jgi:hypothetical protein